MPFSRPTLTALRSQTAGDINASLPGVDALLRFSNLGIMGDMQAGLANGLYGYLDWIALQMTPFTATGEYLEAWGALKGIIRKPATSASNGAVTFTGTSGTIPAGVVVYRTDGAAYTTLAAQTISGTTAVVSIAAQVAGSSGNTSVGASMSLAVSIAGVNSQGTLSTALTGGSDVETDDELRTRVIQAYSQPSQGGAAADYVRWALNVPGVTRAWCVPSGYGAGTVQVLFMMDDAESAYGGFPQGTNGVATAESRAAAATGDQLTVANAIYPQQPVTALVYATAPTPNTVNMTIVGLASAGAATQAAVNAAFAGAIINSGVPGGTTPMSAIEGAIISVANTTGFVITSITCTAGTVTPGVEGNVISNPGALPVAGVITFA